MKSELETLREQKEDYEEQLRDKDHEIEELEDRIYELESDIEESVGLDTCTLDKEMMLEKLAENWHMITMSDIDAICRL